MQGKLSLWSSSWIALGALALVACGGSETTAEEAPTPSAGSGGSGGTAGKGGAGKGGASAGTGGSGGASAGAGGSGGAGAGGAGAGGAGAGGEAGAGAGGEAGAGAGGEAGAGAGGASAGAGGEAGAGASGAGAGGAAGGGGSVECGASETNCNGECVDLLNSAKNCGLCGQACAAGEVCDSANCVAECQAGQTLCNSVCVNTKIDSNHCGKCGNACDKNTVCGDGVCSSDCPASTPLCNGVCTDTKSDAGNCGGCGKACQDSEACVAGVCQLQCAPGAADCGGVCTDTQSDNANCGACGKACAAGELCDAGVCKIDCKAPKEVCGGACTDVQSNSQNCGGCGKACQDSEACEAGVCQLVCDPGLTACGGACVDTQSDSANCGVCGGACKSGEVCSAGQCKLDCSAGQELCGGVCTDTQSSQSNCGGCGQACQDSEACVAGACQPTCKAQLLGNPLTDQWGISWDGNERTAANHAAAVKTCADIGGRLPTATELQRVSAARTSQVGQIKDVNYLWTIVPYDTDEQVTERLSDGAVSKLAVTKTSVYRCACAPPDPPGFSASDCTGTNKAKCDTFERDGRTYNIDAYDRAKLDASSAAWECAYHGGHLLDLGTHIAAIQKGLSNGSTTPHWTSDVASSSTAMTVNWQDGVAWVASNATLSHATLSTVGAATFRCIGPQETPQASPNAPAGGLTLARSGVAFDGKERAAQKWVAAHDTCAFFGGHLAPPVDLMEAMFENMDSGSGSKLWTADQAGFNGTQFLAASVQWTGATPRFAWHNVSAASWVNKTTSPGQPFRCAYYPSDAAYAGPDAAQCNGACFKVPAPGGAPATAPTMWFDALDRPAAIVADAIADCHKSGGRLPRERDYTEAIRASLPNGSTELLYTSDFALASSGRKVHVVRWSQQEPAYDDQYSKYMTWSDLGTKRPYRCMWTSETR